TVTTVQNTAYVFGASDFGFTDTSDNPANTLTAVKITVLPTAGTIADNGTTLTAGQSVSVAEISSGKLIYNPATGGSGTANASVQFKVQDTGGTANGGIDPDPTARTITINVTPVNGAPVGTSQTVTTFENTAYVFGVSDFGFSDPQNTPA